MPTNSISNKLLFIKSLMVFLVILIGTTSCNPIKRFFTSENKLPKTYAESLSSFSYVPIDPLPVSTKEGASCQENGCPGQGKVCFKDMIKSLPDQTVRLAISDLNSSFSASYGPVSVGKKGSTYEVVLDFINADVAQKYVHVKRVSNDGSDTNIPLYSTAPKHLDSRYIVTEVDGKYLGQEGLERISYNEADSLIKNNGEIVPIPVYIGIGLRLTATVQVLKGEANLSSLGALSAGAESGKLIGTMTVQTLGVTGPKVVLPQPSEINQTTIQNALVSLGSIRAVLSTKDDDVTLTPRVVGIYNPIGGGKQVVNGIITALASRRVVWRRPCEQQECN